MHTSANHAAHARNEVHGRSDSNNTDRGANHIDHVVGAAASANGIPMRIESSHRNRNAGLEAELFRPVRGKRSSDLIGRRVFPIELFANTRQ